ncbi:urease accessory protein UreD [Gordonia soli]|uniref:Urease accessory protein UreD n=1 Tax=Gordonia soli NBRC 108243 TaxID=1223545 RepID=M0QQE3_9ACTN|nr:urease accessory protein UreD [Gordonia soli]GAC69672.1 urease accessory protein UreD [Gordonia soli NBRC 108243]
MRTEVEIVAEPGRSPRFRSVGGLAVRRTGAHTVHLIGTAATPLGGDLVTVDVRVHPGARLTMRSVAATIALPALDRADSEIRWHIEVGAGARLVVEPEPTIVAADAVLRTTTELHADPGSDVSVAEHVQLGRTLERDGDARDALWEGALHVDIGSAPVLRHRLRMSAADARPRGLSSTFRHPEHRPDAVSPTDLVGRMTLAGGGSLTTSIADTATAARRLRDELDVPLVGGTSR